MLATINGGARGVEGGPGSVAAGALSCEVCHRERYDGEEVTYADATYHTGIHFRANMP